MLRARPAKRAVRCESQRDTDRHGYTAADETEDGDVGSAPVRGQFVGEEIAGVCAVEVPGHVSSVCSLRMVARVSRALACAGQVLDGLVMDRYRLVPAAWLIACGLPLLSAVPWPRPRRRPGRAGIRSGSPASAGSR